MAGPNSQQDLNDEPPLDPAAERVRRKLVRFMIVNLGILFAAVMAVVLALVYKSLPSAEDASSLRNSSEGSLAVPSGEMLSGEIPVPAGARILSHAASGDRLTLHLRLADGGEEIHLYDLATARSIGRYGVVREAQ